MPRARISREKIKTAIKGSGGVVSRVAVKAGYTWGAVRDFIRADAELAAMFKDEEEAIDDAAESAVIKKILEGDEQTAKWWLARRRRNKFGDSVDLTSGGEKLAAPETMKPSEIAAQVAALLQVSDGKRSE